jgi:hypothetical protein
MLVPCCLSTVWFYVALTSLQEQLAEALREFAQEMKVDTPLHHPQPHPTGRE